MDITFGLSALVATTVGLLYRGQGSIVYMPNYPSESKTRISTPAQHFMSRYKEYFLNTSDNVSIQIYLIAQNGIYLPDNLEELTILPTYYEDNQNIDEDITTIIYFHANAGNLGHRLPIAKSFYKGLKCNVLMVSYRGYGKSEGIPNEQGIYLDSQASLDFILKHPQLSKGKILLYGQSIGSAVAIQLASKNINSISGIILENTFLSIPKLLSDHLPYLGALLQPLITDQWDNFKLIKSLSNLPVLFLTGLKDTLVDSNHSKLLFIELSKTSIAPKAIVTLKEGTHNDTCNDPFYFIAIKQFLTNHSLIPNTDSTSIFD